MRGIYKIINEVNGNYYVGSSKTIVQRWGEHKLDLMRKVHDNKHLQSAWDMYGPDKFKFVVVEEVEHPEYSELLVVEQRYLDIAKSEQSKVYNMKFTAVGGWNWGDPRLRDSLPRGKYHRDYCPDVYTFKNEKTGETFVGTRCDLYTKYGFPTLKCHVRALVRGKRKSVMGWKLA